MLGYGSGFFNNSLSIYYLLVVVYGWKDYQLRKVRPYLLTVPIVCAMILAFSAIPFYDSVWLGCFIVPRPFVDDWAAIGFSFGPIIFTSIISTACQIRVYWSVRTTVRKAQQWSMDLRLKQRSEKDKYTYNAPPSNTSQFITPALADQRQREKEEEEKTKKREFRCNCCKNSPLLQDNAEAAVFWQSGFYLFSYYLCWPVVLVGLANAESQDFVFWMVLAILGPLQGFFNCLVYIRPRVAKWYRAKTLEKERKRKRLLKQQQTKVSQTVIMDTGTGATELGASQSHPYESPGSNALSTPNEIIQVPVEANGGGIEEGTPGSESRKADGSTAPEGSAWDLTVNDRTDTEGADDHEKKFECLS